MFGLCRYRDSLSRCKVNTFAEYGSHSFASNFPINMGFRSCWLDHFNSERQPATLFRNDEIFWPYTQFNAAPGSRFSGYGDFFTFICAEFSTFDQFTRNEAHGRRTDKARDKLIRGTIIEIERRANLLNLTLIHHNDTVPHGHGFDLIVCDIDDRRFQTMMECLNLGAHLNTQLCIKIGQWLIEKENRRLTHNRTSHGDSLTLTAGKLARITIKIGMQIEDRRGLIHFGCSG
ncbi:MAG: hypothetical protein GAK38_03926 [Xylophilus sp.]|nr:MAG: hypothetical protein GAK38_03926 [Xylophilus sp.]